MEPGTTAVQAQAVASRIIHRDTGVVIISVTGPEGTRIRVHFDVGTQPNADFNRVVAHFFQDADPEGEAIDEELAENAPTPNTFTRTTKGTADEFVFGSAISAQQAEQRLRKILVQKLATIDRMCQLTDSQKHKIELAGRGDVARLLQRAARLKQRFDQFSEIRSVDEIQEWATEISAERSRLQILLGPGSFGDGTLFIKVLPTVLTTEQTAALDRRQLDAVAPAPAKGLGTSGGGIF
jgi:hypothetical protein